MKLAWLSHTRMDCLYDINQMAQVTEKIFEDNRKEIIYQYNKKVETIKDENVCLSIPKLDIESLLILGFSDASFGNNRDLSSQLGYTVFLTDKTETVIPIIFKSHKSKRITRSPMSAEVIAFADMFDASASLKQEMEWLLGIHIPLQLLTDSKCLFDIICSGSRTSEKRTMIDVAATREGFLVKIISDIGFVRGTENIADGLTKRMSTKALQNVLNTGKLNYTCEQWIVRKRL